jgi:soluble cytochrome b562
MIDATTEEITVPKEEFEAMERAISRARQYIESDRMKKREWKGWTLDEFDQAIEDLDTIRNARKTNK